MLPPGTGEEQSLGVGWGSPTPGGLGGEADRAGPDGGWGRGLQPQEAGLPGNKERVNLGEGD